jgi:D-3-phosphoglycerate dehydrogenase
MNAPTGNTVSTAELTIALLLAVARWVPTVHNSVTRGDWDRKSFVGVELSGKTLGIVGFGRVGREVALRMKAFGMEIIAFDPFVSPEETGDRVKLVGFQELLGRSDAVTVHVPLTAETRNMIAAAEIAAMKDGALLVNCARGGVVSEAALKQALDSGKLAGVALDVYEKEPPGDNPLFGHPRCVFSPHLGAATGEARVRVATDAATAVALALTTGEIRHPVNRLPE